MRLQQADIAGFKAPAATDVTRASAGYAEPAADLECDDELAPARGLALGLLLGMASLAVIGGTIWWAV